jgi:hypothetical protein
MCGTNMHPSYIFQDMITEADMDRAAITFGESLPYMRKNLSEFLHEHFSEIDEDRLLKLYDYEMKDWENYFTREFIVTGKICVLRAFKSQLEWPLGQSQIEHPCNRNSLGRLQ